MADETVNSRYNRELLQMSQGRKDRVFDQQSLERRQRRFVDPATGNTVTATGDNTNPPATN